MSRPSRKSAGMIVPPRSRRAFTLVELLVVVLILAILMAVALPLYFSAIRTSNRRVARANMGTLTRGNVAYRNISSTHQFTDAVADLIAAGIIQEVPPGPGNTTYSLVVGPGSLPDGRSLDTGEMAACGSDASLGTNGDYGCFIPSRDTD